MALIECSQFGALLKEALEKHGMHSVYSHPVLYVSYQKDWVLVQMEPKQSHVTIHPRKEEIIPICPIIHEQVFDFYAPQVAQFIAGMLGADDVRTQGVSLMG